MQQLKLRYCIWKQRTLGNISSKMILIWKCLCIASSERRKRSINLGSLYRKVRANGDIRALLTLTISNGIMSIAETQRTVQSICKPTYEREE